MEKAFKSGAGDDTPVAGNTVLTKPENRAFYPALDGVRAVAFLMVFGQHYLHMPWGWAGVDLFFVLSGFLITGILFDTRDDRHRVRNFYVRRTLRIFPLYYGVMLAILLLQPLAHWTLNWHWLVWVVYLGNFARFVHPYAAGDALQKLADFQPYGTRFHGQAVLLLGHFWSLCVEEQFYFVWPWLVFWIRDRRRLMIVCAAMIPIGLAMRLGGQHSLPQWMLDNEVLYRATPFRLDALLLGGLLALAIRGRRAQSILKMGRIAFPTALLLVVLFALLPINWPLWHYPFAAPDWRFTWGLTGIDIIAALLILVAIQPGTLVYRVLRIPSLRWMGRISYGAYVFHDIPRILLYSGTVWLARHAGAHWHFSEMTVLRQGEALAAVIGLPATLFVAWLSFTYFESPFLNLKEKWTVRDEEPAAGAPSHAKAIQG